MKRHLLGLLLVLLSSGMASGQTAGEMIFTYQPTLRYTYAEGLLEVYTTPDQQDWSCPLDEGTFDKGEAEFKNRDGVLYRDPSTGKTTFPVIIQDDMFFVQGVSAMLQDPYWIRLKTPENEWKDNDGNPTNPGGYLIYMSLSGLAHNRHAWAWRFSTPMGW